MRRHLAALALLSAVAIPTSASAQVTITSGDVYTINALNDFVTQLNALGYDRYTTTGASMSIAANSAIDFYFLGSESGFTDTFGSGAVSITELLNTDNFPGGAFLGTREFLAGGSLGGELSFTSSAGAPAGLGTAGFGIFLKEGIDYSAGFAANAFILGYDDQISNPDDDNHDDLMILGVVRAVPEPGTWATLLFGFGALGAMMRRKSKAPRIRTAIA